MISLIGKKKNRGFLLLEIMVSVAILSIGFILILSSFVNSVKAIEFSKDYFRAGLLLEEKLCEVYKNDALEIGESEGVFTDFDNRFSWHLDVVELEEPFFKEVNLEVLWGQGNKGQNMSIATYL